ncbi:MAG: helix-turn-helix transcriptional regulator [Eubacteriales bacterium]|nr:helix-turn-helix transcriptional regulator [Eubacteriales bacterium]
MSIFSERLSLYIRQGNFNVIELAKESGFSVALLSKIKAGKRLSADEDKIRALLGALRLAPAQREDLWKEYKIEKMGRGRYQAQQEARNLLLALSETETIDALRRTEVDYVYEYRPVVEGRDGVNAMYQYIVDMELREPGERRLRLMLPTSFRFMRDYLFPATWQRPDAPMEIIHVLELASAMISEADCRNLASIREALEMVGACGKYIPYYYYCDDSIKNPYPYCVISSRHALFINGDGSRALFCIEREVVRAVAQEYDRMRQRCFPLVEEISDGTKYLQGVVSAGGALGSFCAMAQQPCLLHHIPHQMACRHLVREEGRDFGPETETFLQEYFSSTPDGTSIFSEEGLREFLRTGRIWELPEGLYTPLEPEERLEVLGRWLEAMENRNVRGYMMREKWRMTPYLGISDVPSSGLYFFQWLPGEQFLSYRLAEEGSRSVLADLMHTIIESEETYSMEETVERVRELLRGEGR